MDKKALIREYKETTRPMGVYCVRNTISYERSSQAHTRIIPPLAAVCGGFCFTSPDGVIPAFANLFGLFLDARPPFVLFQ